MLFDVSIDLLLKLKDQLSPDVFTELKQAEAQGKPKKSGSSRSGVRTGPGNGWIQKLFTESWLEGKLALTVEEFRELARPYRYISSLPEAKLMLQKSKRVYRENPDGTFSLVKPPKPKLVEVA